MADTPGKNQDQELREKVVDFLSGSGSVGAAPGWPWPDGGGGTMNKIDAIDAEVRAALVSLPGKRQGIRVQGSPEVLAALALAGLIGPGGGLTRSGTILVERLKRQALEAAFA